MGIKHTKVSSVTDSANTNLVRPSDWNDDHTIDGDVDLGGHDLTNVGNPEDFGSTEFIGLDDVPATYAGSGNKLVRVNAGATALEFVAPSAGGPVDEFVDLTDVPASYSGETGKLLAVNAGETALEFIEASSTGTNLGWVTPQDYYPDAGQPGFESDQIDAADIAAHTEWIGTYMPGSYWSYVALQEAIYGAFAYYDSTPGNVVWNNQNLRTNKTLYMPEGVYYTNHQLHMTAQNFNFMCSGRGTSSIRWRGSMHPAGTSHSTDIIDGMDPALVAQIDVDDQVWITGPGIIERSVAIIIAKPSATSIQLNSATSSSVTGNWFLYHTPFRCNAVSYGAFRNVTIHVEHSLPAVGTTGVSLHRPAAWEIDWDGANPGLKTQQVTLYDPLIFGNFAADVGISISPNGGIAQGDTILIVNPVCNQFWRAGLSTLGANALNIQVINGNFQSDRFSGIQCHGGSVYVYGSSFQPGIQTINFSPVLNSVANMSADIWLKGFGGPSSNPVIRDIRSEAQQLVYATDTADPIVSGVGTAAVETLEHITDYAFQIGHYIHRGTPSRTFLCVSCGGPDVWYMTSTGSGSTNTLTLVGASWSVNQWVGLRLFERFGSNGYTQENGTITSNTANTVTWSGAAASPAPDSLYFIGGHTDTVDPGTAAFTAAGDSTGAFDAVGSGQGFTTTRGSTTIGMGSGLSSSGATVGDYIAIPQVDRLGCTQEEVNGVGGRCPPIKCLFTAQITALPGGGNVTVNKAPAYSGFELPGWHQDTATGGTVVVDGDITWMPIDTFDFWGCWLLEKCTANRVYNCMNVIGLRSSNDYNWMTARGIASSTDSKNIVAGKTVHHYPGVSISSAATPVDITLILESTDYVFFTPTQNITLTIDTAKIVPGIQKFTIVVVTSGVTPYTVTFGTGFRSSGTLSTGAVSGKMFIVEFAVLGDYYFNYAAFGAVEVSRTVAL